MAGNRLARLPTPCTRAQSHYDRAGAELSRRQLDLVIPSDISQLAERHQRQSSSEAGSSTDRLLEHTQDYVDRCLHCLQSDAGSEPTCLQ